MDKEDKWINININININIDGEDNRTIGYNCLGRRIPGARACPPVFIGHSKDGNLELEFVRLREEEIGRRQQPDLHHSMADRVLEEDAARARRRAFRKEVGYEDQMQKSTSGEGMAVGTWVGEGNSEFLGQNQEKEGEDTWGGEKLRSGEIPRLEGLECYGTAGGVLICWDKRSLEILDWEEGQFSISCRFRNVGDGGIWVFTGVYGPFSREERECLWEEIGAIRGLWEEPWCLGGDFNTILYHFERSRNGRITLAMRRFAQIIDDLRLVDLPLQGGSFTWSGGLNNQSWARLDRFLATPSWLDQYSRVSQRRLPRPTSDHFPVLLEGGGLRRGGWWQGIVVRGSPSYRLAVKLKGLKQNLKIWNKEVFESLERNKAEALQQEHGVFHRMANGHRRVNALDKIKINGVRLTEEQEVREGIANVYQQLLSESSGWKADIGGLLLKQISHSEAEALELPFSEVEIHAALMGMNGDKAPGSDGFMVAFWQRCWETVKEDVLDMFKEFHEQNSFIKSLNHTFLVLLPKKGGAEDMGDYRPISLLGGLYKLLTKVLANRLKKVIGNVVSSDQNAFIKGRQILDASLIANEVIDSWQKRGEKGLICYAKDGIWAKMVGMDVELHIHCQVLTVGERCASWVFLKFEGVTSRGPSFPYLFVMGMEVLSVLITRAVEGALFLGVASGEEEGRLGLRLKINLDKSEVIPIGEVEGVNEMAVEIECRVGQLPAVYLGLPLGASNKAISVWDGVEEKHSLVSNVFVPYAKSVARRLEKLQRDFLWEGPMGGKKSTLSQVGGGVCDKEKGGLGLRKLACLNKALLGKWIWRFARAKEDLWKKEFEGDLEGVRLVLENMVFKDCHSGGNMGSEFWSRRVELRFLRAFNDWELDMVGNLLVELREYRVTLEEDSVIWKEGGDGLFRVKKAYSVLASLIVAEFPYSNVWVDRVPTKIAFFAWEAAWGKVLTLDRLQRRGCNSLTVVSCWVFPRSVKEVLCSWKGSFVGKKRKKLWKSIPLYIFGQLEGEE
ncbi:Transposon TX1 uncharacterized 149 kDa protein [Vitis vinifera]|uniref:Transposon TX1 uncharacterized 149 kDa protein n=1 Tax=Vitis vinifera TaxID=29760 RepID=A0A438DX28_VITVI|nr:Transposon TX1 uncharacterized 149 kDa protein [Vitis vinifera]